MRKCYWLIFCICIFRMQMQNLAISRITFFVIILATLLAAGPTPIDLDKPLEELHWSTCRKLLVWPGTMQFSKHLKQEEELLKYGQQVRDNPTDVDLQYILSLKLQEYLDKFGIVTSSQQQKNPAVVVKPAEDVGKPQGAALQQKELAWQVRLATLLNNTSMPVTFQFDPELHAQGLSQFCAFDERRGMPVLSADLQSFLMSTERPTFDLVHELDHAMQELKRRVGSIHAEWPVRIFAKTGAENFKPININEIILLILYAESDSYIPLEEATVHLHQFILEVEKLQSYGEALADLGDPRSKDWIRVFSYIRNLQILRDHTYFYIRLALYSLGEAVNAKRGSLVSPLGLSNAWKNIDSIEKRNEKTGFTNAYGKVLYASDDFSLRLKFIFHDEELKRAPIEKQLESNAVQTLLERQLKLVQAHHRRFQELDLFFSAYKERFKHR